MNREWIVSESIVSRICEYGFEAYLCGGAVRDEFIGKSPSDVDVVTNATPTQLVEIFKDKKVKTFGVSFLVTNIDGIDVATYRTDHNKENGRHKCITKPCSTLQEDLQRRDFTFNALAICPNTGDIIDLFGGREDLKNGIVRFIGEPEKRIFEDNLRMIRAARFACLINGTIEKKSFEAIKNNNHLILNVAPERIRIELMKVMKYEHPSIFFSLLYETGILKLIMPEYEISFGHPGGPYHGETLEKHSFLAGDFLSHKNPVLRLAGFFHDIGKPTTYDKETESFKGHEKIGSEIVKSMLKRFCFTKNEICQIKGLVRYHMRTITHNSSSKSIRRLLKTLDENRVTFKNWLLLKIADKQANLKKGLFGRENIRTIVLKAHRSKIKKKIGFGITDLNINGNDIMEILNIKPSKKVGEILKQLLEIVLDEPEKNKYEILVKEIKKIRV